MVLIRMYLQVFLDGICVIIKDKLVDFSPQVILVLQYDPQVQGFIDKPWGGHGWGLILESLGCEFQIPIQDHQLMAFWGINEFLLKSQ